MTTRVTYYDDRGRPISVGAKLGEGGEGAVYELSAKPDAVAKVYHKSLPTDKQVKLTSMVRAYEPELGRVSAWPMELLRGKPGGEVVGLVMPKVLGYDEIYTLYSPVQRKSQYPRADWQFLIQAARNAAAAVATVHAHGHVIGDINPNNLVVAPDATIKLIDCDSFQIKFQNQLYHCLVGVPEFTPPELQGKPFDSTERTPNHDAFGLAVTVFHLLFMGRHPFAGRYSGHGDMPIARAIGEGRYAYSSRSNSMQMAPPPHTLPALAVSGNIQKMFEVAFDLPSARVPRPSASQWVGALEELKNHLVTCGICATHKYWRGLTACPWCKLETNSGTVFFIGNATSSQFPPHFDVNAKWARIKAVPVPGDLPVPTYSFPGLIPRPIPGVPIVAVGQVQPRMDKASYKVEQDSRQHARDLAKQAWDRFVRTWNQEASDRTFRTKMKEAEARKEDYARLEREYLDTLRQMERSARDSQFNAYMQSQSIAKAKIPGIGAQRAATLAAYGIATAADVNTNAVMSVPGFGSSLAASLQVWRHSVETSFVFDARKSISPADRAKLERLFKPKYIDLQNTLTAVPGELDAIQSAIVARRKELTTEGEPLARGLAQAEADLTLLKLVKPPSVLARLLHLRGPTVSAAAASTPAGAGASKAGLGSLTPAAGAKPPQVSTTLPSPPPTASNSNMGCGCLVTVMPVGLFCIGTLYLQHNTLNTGAKTVASASTSTQIPRTLVVPQLKAPPPTRTALTPLTPAEMLEQGAKVLATAMSTDVPSQTHTPTKQSTRAMPTATVPTIVSERLTVTPRSATVTPTDVPVTPKAIVDTPTTRPTKPAPTATVLPVQPPPTATPATVTPATATPTASPTITATPRPLSVPLPTVTVPPTRAVALGVTTANANLRAGPGTTFEIIGSVAEGNKVGIIARDDSGLWYQLATGSWIFGELVKLDAAMPGETTTPTASPTPSFSATPTDSPPAS